MARYSHIAFTFLVLLFLPFPFKGLAQTFVHPGCLSTTNDFARMTAKVNAAAHPWIDTWNILVNNSSAQTTYTPHPQTQIVRGGTGTQTYQYAYQDAAAAYQLGLRWQITGDNSYANTATNILNQWANTCTNVTGDSNYALAGGLYGYEFACAAENLRGYAGWKAADFAKFQSFMTNVFYSANNGFLTGHNGTCSTHYFANWDLCNMASMLAIGVLCDRRDIYNQAIAYYTNGIGAGAANHVMTSRFPGYLGQCQESGRDQGHCTLDPVLLSVFCEIAWNQGDDMYGYNTNTLLALSEYVCKYNLLPFGPDLPYVCYMDCEYYNSGAEDGGIMPVIASGSRGTLRPGWSLIYNHYVNRRGLAASWTGLMAGAVDPEGGGGNYGSTSGGYDQLGFTTLTHTLDPIPPASVPAPGSLIVQPRNNTVTVSWLGSAEATSYNIKRANALAGTYTNIASVPAPVLSYVDIGLTQGSNYFYEVSAIINGNETTNSLPVSATPNVQLTGAVIGSPGSYKSAGAGITCLFDGSLQNFYDAFNGSGDWGGLDLGRSNVITQVAYCPRSGFSSRMVGGQFQGANVSDFSSGVVSLFTISSTPADTTPPSLTFQTISNPNAFRYVRYLGPANGSCNAAEIQFFGAPSVPTPPAAPLNLQADPGNQQAVLTWSEADTATSYNVKRGNNSGGLYQVIATNVLTTTFTDTGLSNYTNYFYVVSAVNGAGESTNSAEVTAAPSPGLRAGSLVWSGGTNGIWDTTSPNWMTNFVPAIFQNGGSVLFDDTAWLAGINLPSSVSPTAVTFNIFSKDYTLSGSPIAGAASIQMTGSGSVTFSSANTFSNGITIAGGTAIVGNGNAFGTGPITLAGGAIQWGGTGYTITNAIVAQAGTTSTLAEAGSASVNFSGNITGGGTINANSSANYGGAQLSGDNHGFTGTFITGGGNSQRFRFLSASAGSANANWVFNSTTTDGQGFSFSTPGAIHFGTISGAGYFRNDAGAAVTMEIGELNADCAFSGTLNNSAGIIGLLKAGAGTLLLSGAGSYSGQTTVTNGELIVSSTFACRSTCLVTNGAAFGVTNSASGSGAISNLVLAAGTTLEMINVSSSTTPLLLASNVVVGGSCIAKITGTNGLVAGGIYPLIKYAGSFSGALANLQLQMPYGWRGTLANSGNQLLLTNIAVVSTVSPQLNLAGTGQQLQVGWPLANTGWRLEVQTNSPGIGLGTNWVNVVGAASTNQFTIPVGLANGNVFFRLVYP